MTVPLESFDTVHVHLSFFSCLLGLGEDRFTLLTKLIGVYGGGVISDVYMKYGHQVILVIFGIIHCPAVFEGTATHPTETLESGLVHLVWLLSHLHALIYVEYS